MKITEMFCEIDDFCNVFIPKWERYLISLGYKQRRRKHWMVSSEIMTITVLFHISGYRTFKHFYTSYVCCYLRDAFPNLVSYNRFIELQKNILVPICAYLKQYRRGKATGIFYIDSAKIPVCHNMRIASNKVFHNLAQRGCSSTGWFYGFKLHLIINDAGELIDVTITPGNTDDRKPVTRMAKGLSGKLFGDKGYISKHLYNQLNDMNLELITNVRKNMKETFKSTYDTFLLGKRRIIESVFEQLKNHAQVEHTRHRSIWNFLVNIISGCVAYTFQEKKPSLNLTDYQRIEAVYA